MKVILVSIIGFIIVGCMACSNKPDQLGRFVFVDDEGVYHTNNVCPKLQNGKDSYGHSIYAMQPRDTTDFIFNDSERICSYCVSISSFEHLKFISERNKKYDADRLWLYNKLIKANCGMGSYKEFITCLSDIEKRKHLHQIALEEGWDVGNFEEFSKGLGFTCEAK